jgi:hypothetical protein
MMLFHMIGNTDFSIFQLHNVMVQTQAKVFYPIIWDFDITGYSAPTAKPTETQISTPRERSTGPCRSMAGMSIAGRLPREAGGALALLDLPGWIREPA